MYERALRRLRATQPDAKEEAVMLLQAWLAFEKATTRCAELVAGVMISSVLAGCGGCDHESCNAGLLRFEHGCATYCCSHLETVHVSA